jgi:glycosyltransferase involved in cell wall biosynthesis
VPNIQFLPSVKHSETWAYYAMADINIVCLKNIPDFDMFIPSKMFEIMASETCAVAGLRGEGAEIMKESGGALVVPSEEADRMAEAISTLLDDPQRRKEMAKAGLEYVSKNFLHSRLAGQYAMLMKQLVEGPKK